MRMVTVVALGCVVLSAVVAGASEFQRTGSAGAVNAMSRGDAGRAFALDNAVGEFQAALNTAPGGAVRFVADAPGAGIASSAYMKYPAATVKQFAAFGGSGTSAGAIMGQVPQDLELKSRQMPRGTVRQLMKFAGDEASWFGAMDLFNAPPPVKQAMVDPKRAGSIVDDPATLGLTVVSRD